MSFMSLCFSNPCYLSLKNKQLFVKLIKENEELSVPLDNVASIVLDNAQITLTSQLLSKLSELGIALFTVDSKHIPNGCMNSFLNHIRTSATAFKQIELAKPFKKNIWKEIVSQKIHNQGYVLERYNEEKGKYLQKLALNVKSGDSENLESVAARVYFLNLFGKKFTRDQENKINSLLNYGYTVLRGYVARFVASKGLIPCFGVFHRSTYNSFNLADDLIEPFRPIIDMHVAEYVLKNNSNTHELTVEDKKYILDLMNTKCVIDNENTTLSNAIALMCDSFVRAMDSKDYKLISKVKINATIWVSKVYVSFCNVWFTSFNKVSKVKSN